MSWAVAAVVNDTAKRDLAQLGRFEKLDTEGRQAHLETLLAWCRDNAGKTSAQLVLQTLGDSRDWHEFQRAATEAVHTKLMAAHAVLGRRIVDFPRLQQFVAEFCYLLDVPESAADARTWIRSADKGTRFWAALILLKHGDTAKQEGQDVLAEVLAKDDGSDFYPRAIDPLLAAKTESALTLALGILRKPRFFDHFNFHTSDVLHRLFLTGRRECLDFLLQKLDLEGSDSHAHGERYGVRVERGLGMGDWTAEFVMSWRIDEVRYQNLAPDNERRAAREKIKTWLKEQFTLINEGKPHQIEPPKAMSLGQAWVDTP